MVQRTNMSSTQKGRQNCEIYREIALLKAFDFIKPLVQKFKENREK